MLMNVMDSHTKRRKHVTETEKRVGNLLISSQRMAAPENSSGSSLGHGSKEPSLGIKERLTVSTSKTDSCKEKLNLELKQRQDTLKGSDNCKEIQSFREKLPAFNLKAEFLKAVKDNQGLTFPVNELFLEDVLEKTRYAIQDESDNFNSRRGRRRREQEGWDEISKLLDQVLGNKFLGDENKFLVLPLHGSMPTVNQHEIFDRPPANK